MTAPKIETTTRVEIDERTKDELQPPCDALDGGAPCALPAAWACLLGCDRSGTEQWGFGCDRHMRDLRDGRVVCDGCLQAGTHVPIIVKRAEPLR